VVRVIYECEAESRGLVGGWGPVGSGEERSIGVGEKELWLVDWDGRRQVDALPNPLA
jgi:hypothetical protein